MSEPPGLDSTDVDGLDGYIQWPSANAHLRPSTDSDISYGVTIAPNTKQTTELDYRTRSSPSPPVYREPSRVQPILYAERVSPQSLPQRDPDKELTMEDWDPMKDDFESKTFNSYNSGPVAGLSGRQDTNMAQKGADNWHRLYIGGIPREMSEDGLANLVGQVCQTSNVKVIPAPDESRSFTFGFCNVPSANDMQKVITKLNGYMLKGHSLRVNMATPKDNNPRSPPSSASSPRDSMKSSFTNNNTMQNRPVTPRRVEDRYGKTTSKSPSSPHMGSGDAPNPSNQPRVQNGTQSSGDEIKQSSLDMVPMAVTRNAHKHQMEGSKTAAEHRIPNSTKDTTMPSKGRGQVLQNMLTGKQPQHVGASHQVSKDKSQDVREQKKMLDREYDKMQHGREHYDIQQDSPADKMQQGREHCDEQLGTPADKMQQGREQEKMQPDTERDKTQHGREHCDKQQGSPADKMQQGREQEKMQPDKEYDKMQHGREPCDQQLRRPADKTQQSREQGKMQESMEQGKMQPDRGMERNKVQQGRKQNYVQQGRQQGNMQQGRGRDKMQQNRYHDRKSNTTEQKARGKKVPAKSERNMQIRRKGEIRMKLPSTGRGRALETMLDSTYQPLEGDRNSQDQPSKSDMKEIQYVLLDKNNKVEYIGVLEESPEKASPTQVNIDDTRIPHSNIAQVLHLEERSPPRPYRDIPDGYPNPGYHMPPAFGYGPFPPPWMGGYYGCYPHEAPPMSLWRPPPQRPPPPSPNAMPYDFFPTPRRHSPRKPYFPRKQYHRFDNQRAPFRSKRPPLMSSPQDPQLNPRYRRLSSTYSGSDHEYEEMPPSTREVQIRELSRSPSPNRRQLATAQSLPPAPCAKADVTSPNLCEPVESMEASVKPLPAANIQTSEQKADGVVEETDGIAVCPVMETTSPETVPSASQEAAVSPSSKLEQDANSDGIKSTPDLDNDGMMSTPDLDKDGMMSTPDLDNDGMKSTPIPDVDNDEIKSTPDLDKDGIMSTPDLDNDRMKSTPTPDLDNDDMKSTPDLDNDGIKSTPELDNDGMKSTPDLDNDGMKSTPNVENAVTESSQQHEQERSTDVKEVVVSELSEQQRGTTSTPTKSPSPSKHGKDDKGKRRPCINCGNLGTSKCSKCKTPYCTRECQSKHWAQHKLECSTIATGGKKEPTQQQQAVPAPPRDVKTPSPGSRMFASKPAYAPHPQASAVYGRFLSKDIPEAKPETQSLTVLVTEVVSPDCIYMQLIQRSSCLAYVELRKLMLSTYPGLPTAKELHFYLTQVGELCAAEKTAEWHRAEILSMSSPDQGVDVMLVDFGQCVHVPRNSLKKLKDDMVKLPKQGVRCFLTGICSAENDGRWSGRASELLRARIFMKECRAEFRGRDEQRGYEINLFASKDTTVSEELISAHLAKSTTTPTSSPTQQSEVPVLDGISEGSKQRIQLGHIASMDIIYGTLAEQSGNLVLLQETLNSPGVVDDSDRTYFLPEAGQLIAARYQIDNHWYRAKVNNITTPEKCSVQFVDYGNREEIAIRDCQKLPAQFHKQPFQAVRLVLAGVQRPPKGWPEGIEMAFRTWICEGDVEVMVVRKHTDHIEVELFSPKSPDPQLSFNSILTDAGFTQAPQATSEPASEPAPEQAAQNVDQRAPEAIQSSSEVLNGMVVWVNNPSDFYIQLQDDADVLTTLLIDLTNCYANSNNDADYAPVVGDMCVALFQGAWYRAKVVEAMSPISTNVFFLDYGNEDIVENDDIRPMKAQFRDMPGKALLCGLDVAPSSGQDGKWTDKAIAVMKQKAQDKRCTVRVKSILDGRRLVEVECEGADISNELVQAKLAVVGQVPAVQAQPPPVAQAPSAVPPSQPVDSVQLPAVQMPPNNFRAMVCWVNSPSEVFIQIAVEENIKAFQELEISLQVHDELPTSSAYQPQVGDICVAKSVEFKIWLRARVVAVVAPNCCRVLYLDYGNEEDVTGNVHKIEEKFCQSAIMAIPCSLAGVCPFDGTQWSAKATDFLKEQILNQVVEVSLSSDQPRNSITLTKDGMDIAKKLFEAGFAKYPHKKTTPQASPISVKSPVASPPAAAPKKPTPQVSSPVEKTPPAVMAKTLTIGTIKPPAQKFKAAMTHINNPSDMYINVYIAEDVKAFQDLEVEIGSHCETTGPSEQRLITGNLCIAKCVAYGGWYRARIIESRNKGVVKVHFVDYGNEEEVKADDVRPLLERFTRVPAMAVHCSLAGVCPPGGGKIWNKEAIAFVQNKMMGQVLEAIVIESSSSTYSIDFTIHQDNGPPISISKELIKTSLAKDPSHLSPPRKGPPHQAASPKESHTGSPPKKEMQGQRSHVEKSGEPTPAAVSSSKGAKVNIPLAIPPENKFEARITVVNHPCDMYIALQGASKDNEGAMQKLRSELTEHYSNLPNANYRPEVSDFVVANRKGMWGRAKVVEATGNDRAKLLFVDYGMTDVVEYNKIGKLEERFAKLPMMALHCGIAGIKSPGNKPWKQETITTVREKILGCKGQVLVKSSAPNSDLHNVELLVTMKNGNPLKVRDELIKYRLAFPANQPERSPQGHNQPIRSPQGSNQPIRSPQGPNQPIRSPQGSNQALRSPQGPNQGPSHPLKSPQGPGLNKNPSGGAFHTYQRSQPSHDPSHGKSPDTQRGPKPLLTAAATNTKSSPPKPKVQVPADKEFQGTVIWFNNPDSFYVWAKDTLGQVKQLHETLANSYTTVAKSSYRPNVGEIVVTKFDQDWCRALVENVSGDTADVVYIDYGNQDKVQISGVYKVTDEIRKMPVLALHCALAGVVPSGGSVWSEETIHFAKPKVENQACQVHVIDANSDVCKVRLSLQEGGSNQSIDMKVELIQKGFAVESTHAPTRSSPTMGKSPEQVSSRGLAIKFPDQGVDSQAEVDGVKQSTSPSQNDRVKKDLVTLQQLPLPSTDAEALAVVVNNPGSFFVHIVTEDNAEALTQLGKDMNSFYSKPGIKCYKPKKGELCAAKFIQDGGWYRATAIRESSGGTMKVAFVDFGNEEEVSCDAIKELNEEFHKLPVMAQHCCLAGILPSEKQGGQWRPEVTEYMKSKVMNGLCTVRVVDPSTNPISVELVFGLEGANPNINLSEELLQKNMAKRGATSRPSPSKPQDKMSAPKDVSTRPKQAKKEVAKKTPSTQIQEAQLPAGTFKGVISWVNDPSDLFLQVASEENQALMRKLTELSSCYGNRGPSQYRPVIGSPCAALYQATGDWCRAVAMEYMTRNEIKVVFVDFGNTEVVSCENVHKLEDRFIIGAPPVAAHCALSGIKPVGSQWSKEATFLIAQQVDRPCDVKFAGRREGIPGLLVDITPESSQVSLKQQLIDAGVARHGEPIISDATANRIQQPTTPLSPPPATTNGMHPSRSPTLPSPTTNGIRSVSRASNGSGESVVDALHMKMTEQEKQIQMQQKMLEEQNKQIKALQEMMMANLGRNADK